MKIQNQMLSENESRTLLLQDKVAVVFGAAGAVGSKVANVFSHEGARVFLSGRRLDPIEKIAKEINVADGKADAAEVDALDEEAVTAYLDRVVVQAGRIDVVYNAVGPQAIEYDNAKPTIEVSYEKFPITLNTYVASNFLTARAAAHHMLPRQRGRNEAENSRFRCQEARYTGPPFLFSGSGRTSLAAGRNRRGPLNL